MTAPPPEPREPAVDRGLVLRALAGAVAIGLLVGLLGAGVWLAVVSRERAPSPVPTGIALASPSASAVASARGSASASAGDSASHPSSASAGASRSSSPSSSAATVEPVTAVGSSAVVSEAMSPFADCTAGGTGEVTTNSEVEPAVAVDPAHPGTIVAAWQQDRWANGAARGIVAAASSDGGRSWQQREPPFSACAPGGKGQPTRVSDPWLSFGTDGTAYLAGLSVTQPDLSSVTVSLSHDGGRTWSTPEAVATSETARMFNDKESVTADPNRPGHAYLVWDRSGAGENETNGQPGAEGSVMLATTADSGKAWSAGRAIAALPGTPIGNEIAVLPDGSLVDVFVLAPRSAQGLATETALRSTDAGATWSDPITIATLSGRDVIASQPPGVRGGGGLPDVAVDQRSGTIYATWTDRQDGTPAVVISTSHDGGRTWSTPSALPRPARTAVFMPSIELTATGIIGVEYTDVRAATSAAPLLADRFLTVSADGGTTWRERRLTDSFDLSSAPNAGGRFLGDYSGLATTGETFVSAFSITTGSVADPTQLIVRSDPAVDPAAIEVR